jgi:hypothetical protein
MMDREIIPACSDGPNKRSKLCGRIAEFLNVTQDGTECTHWA